MPIAACARLPERCAAFDPVLPWSSCAGTTTCAITPMRRAPRARRSSLWAKRLVTTYSSILFPSCTVQAPWRTAYHATKRYGYGYDATCCEEKIAP
jgi:hypothetical protein